MSNLYQHYQLDNEAENDGKWVEFREGIQVKVRSDNSTKVREITNRLAKKYRPKLMANNWVLPPKDQDASDVELTVSAVVVDWRGVTDAEGKPLDCTKENVRKVMSDLPAFRREVLMASRLDETFRAETVAAMEGNSETP